MNNSLSDLTILVPSKNGLERLRFLCNWLKENKFDGCYLIIDGTTNNQETHFREFKFVSYIHRPECNPSEALSIGSKFIKSEFSTHLGDDDLPLLKKYIKLIGFLKSNSDYDSARGCSSFINFEQLSGKEKLGPLTKLNFIIRTFFSARYDNDTNLDHFDELDRLMAMSQKYIVNQFFVTKSTIFKKLLNHEYGCLSDIHLAEYALAFSHALFARTKYIPILYMIRGLGKHRPNSDTNAARHKIDISGKMEKELGVYLESLNVEDHRKQILYRIILSKRYISENNRLLGLNEKKSLFKSLGPRAYQLLFSLCHQTIEKWKLVFFRNKN